jgi:hypothetical protein
VPEADQKSKKNLRLDEECFAQFSGVNLRRQRNQGLPMLKPLAADAEATGSNCGQTGGVGQAQQLWCFSAFFYALDNSGWHLRQGMG